MNVKLSYYSLARITLFLTLILLAIISILSYQKIYDLINFDKKVIHTREVLYKFERVVSILKEAESGQRGFLLSGDSLFLQTFNNSKLKLDSLIKDLKLLTIDNLVQTHKIDTLTMLIQKRYELMNILIHLVSTNNIKNEDMILSLRIGKNVMDQISGVIERSQKEEEDLLFIRNKVKDSITTLTPFYILLFTFFSLILILVSYFILIREFKKKIIVQKDLENKIEELNRSNNELEQFAYVASHDLQEPLRKIRSFGDRLVYKHSDLLDEDGKFNIQKMQDAAIRMQKLIDDLLGFSRLVRSENKFELTNLNELVASVLNDMDEIIKSKKAKIKVEKLPLIFSVPSQMHQLFQNIINNALKFSRKEVPPEITIHYAIVKGNEIKDIKPSNLNEYFHRFIISDNGIGFDEQYLDRIFIIFQRLHGKMEYGGTGIGLAVSKKIVLNHAGYITAKSRPDSGSSFYIYIPENLKI